MCQYLIRVYFSPSLSFPSPISPSGLQSKNTAAAVTLLKCEQKGPCFSLLSFPFLLRKASAADLGFCSNARSSRSRWAAGGPLVVPCMFHSSPRVCFSIDRGTNPSCRFLTPSLLLPWPVCLCRSWRFERAAASGWWPWAAAEILGARDPPVFFSIPQVIR